MIDFSKKDLYSKKKRDMEKFLTNILITESQRDDYEEIEDDDDESLDDFLGGDFGDDFDDDFGSSFGEDDFGVGFGSLGDGFQNEDGNEEENLPYNKDNVALDLLVSPYYLFYYMFKSISENKTLSSTENQILLLKNQVKVSSVVLMITLFLLMFTQATFIFSLTIQTFIAIGMVVSSLIGIKVLNNKDKIMSYGGITVGESGSLEEDGISGFDDFADEGTINEDSMDGEIDFGNDLTFDDMDIGEDVIDSDSAFDFDFGDEDIGFGDEDIDFGEFSIDEDDMFNLPEEDEDFEEELVEGGSPIPHSILDVRDKESKFLMDLENIYKENEKYRGVEITDREELVKSLSGYLIANDKGFGKWSEVEENTIVYNNIMYTIYLGLIEIQHAFKDISDRHNKMIINSCVENPLMYRIEFEVPKKYFKSLVHQKEVFESKLKVSDSDTEVMVMVSNYREGFVLKIVKPVRSFVSLGDILRFHNDQVAGKQVYEKYLDVGTALPLVLGLRDVEYPEIVDLADNTSVVIAGESGSGKSWGTFLVMINLIFTNNYNDMNVVIMDRKKSAFWKEFARMPHVIGYHTDVPEYFDLLKELVAEMEYRKQILLKSSIENWKGLRKGLIKSNRFDQLRAFPWLIIIIDEVSNTMKEIKTSENGDDKLKEFEDYLTMISQEGRSLGIKLVLIGQRTIAAAMPKNAMENSSLKFAFKLSEADMSKVVALPKGFKPPQVVGQAVLQDAEMSSPVLLRTLTVGGIDDSQILNIIRILAYEWTRRSEGNVLTRPRGMRLVYNRDVIREKVFEDMSNNRLFISDETTDLTVLADALIMGEDISHITEDDLYVKPEEKEEEEKETPVQENKIRISKEDDFDEEDFSFSSEDELFANLLGDSGDNSIEDGDLDDLDDVDDVDGDFDGFDDFTEDEEDFDFDFDFDIDFSFDDVDDFENVSIEEKETEEEDKLSIRDYIIKNGDGNNFKYLDKESVENNYSMKEINRALLKSEITEDGDTYKI